MSTNVVNQVAFLRTSRLFPEDAKELTLEINKTYVDIANAVNSSVDGIFPVNQPAITRESWFLTKNTKQQSLRQIYTFTTNADIPIGFKFNKVDKFVRIYGTYTDATNWYGLIPTTTVAIAGQIGIFLFLDGASTTTDLIRFTTGVGAPAIDNGIIVIEWISRP